MAKRLKKRIQEVCGLNNLDRDEKIKRANEILNSTELKQAICNEILGASFKDIERAMVSILKERHLTQEQQEMLELSEESANSKFGVDDVEFNSRLHTKQQTRYMDPSSQEYRTFVERMVREHFEYKSRGNQPAPESKSNSNLDYKTYSREEVHELLKGYERYKDPNNKY